MDPNIAGQLFIALKNAIDLREATTYLDAGLADERKATVVYSAPSFGSFAVTDTYTYAGSAGAYRLTLRARSFTP
jgi:hypothetical protein